jgi:hypothetical protein
MNFRLRYWLAGGHVHVRLFSGKARNMTHAKCGDLVFRFDEWPSFLACLYCGGNSHVEVVHEDEELP